MGPFVICEQEKEKMFHALWANVKSNKVSGKLTNAGLSIRITKGKLFTCINFFRTFSMENYLQIWICPMPMTYSFVYFTLLLVIIYLFIYLLHPF